MVRRNYDYRKVYIKAFGKPPKDVDGRSYDIHHKDGDHSNNDPANLIAVPITEHYDIHYQLQQWRACYLIGLRMKKAPEELSKLSKLVVAEQLKNGTHPWQSGEMQRATMNRMVKDGTHHMLGGKIQKEFQLKRSEAGDHQWCGPSANKAKLLNGTHSSQVTFTCPQCGTSGKGSTNAKRWHFDNCRKKVN